MPTVEKTCPRCGSNRLIKRGFEWSKGKRIQEYSCTKCGRFTMHPVIRPIAIVAERGGMDG